MRLVASQRVIVNNDCVYADVSDLLFLQGQKRRAVEEESSSSLSSSPTVESSAADSSFSLNTRYGLNAWRRWATSEASPSSQSKGKERKRGISHE